MNTSMHIATRDFALYRFPAHSQHPSLQAWGSEDELVLSELHSNSADLGRVLVLNDEFGALGCALSSELFSLNHSSVWQSDSYVATCALRENLSRNALTCKLTVCSSLTKLSERFDTVLLRLPKNSYYLQHQLQQLKHIVDNQTKIIAFGKVKMVTSPTLKLIEAELGPTRTSLAVKKSRLVHCTAPTGAVGMRATPMLENQWTLDKKFNSAQLTIKNLANVFAAKQLDIGARFMLDNLPPFNDERVIDLGCGNGVLGLTTLAQSSHCHLTFVDESYMAVESAKRSVQHNLPDKLKVCEFVVDNCLDSLRVKQTSQGFDRVLCNPPFHQQNTLTDHIAWQMFNDAKACLRQGGKLWVVGNRHLGYHDKLKRVFGGTKVLASNAKFVILEAIKR